MCSPFAGELGTTLSPAGCRTAGDCWGWEPAGLHGKAGGGGRRATAGLLGAGLPPGGPQCRFREVTRPV